MSEPETTTDTGRRAATSTPASPTAASPAADSVPVVITPRAAERVLANPDREKGPDAGLRLSVVKGGCSGYEYLVKFVGEPAEGDLAWEAHGLRVFLDPESREYLEGTELDFDDSLYGGGLRFRNPNATATCGCGTSFAATPTD